MVTGDVERLRIRLVQGLNWAVVWVTAKYFKFKSFWIKWTSITKNHSATGLIQGLSTGFFLYITFVEMICDEIRDGKDLMLKVGSSFSSSTFRKLIVLIYYDFNKARCFRNEIEAITMSLFEIYFQTLFLSIGLLIIGISTVVHNYSEQLADWTFLQFLPHPTLALILPSYLILSDINIHYTITLLSFTNLPSSWLVALYWTCCLFRPSGH